MSDLHQGRLNQTLHTLRMLGEQASRIQQEQAENRINKIKRAVEECPILSLFLASTFLLVLSPLLLTLVIIFGPALLILCAVVSVVAAVVMLTMSLCFVCLLCWTVFVSSISSYWFAFMRGIRNAVCRIKDELLYIANIPSMLWEEFKSNIHETFTRPFREQECKVTSAGVPVPCHRCKVTSTAGVPVLRSRSIMIINTGALVQ